MLTDGAEVSGLGGLLDSRIRCLKLCEYSHQRKEKQPGEVGIRAGPLSNQRFELLDEPIVLFHGALVNGESVSPIFQIKTLRETSSFLATRFLISSSASRQSEHNHSSLLFDT